MQKSTLEMLSIEGPISLDRGVCIGILDVGKAFTGLSASIESNVNLGSISI